MECHTGRIESSAARIGVMTDAPANLPWTREPTFSAGVIPGSPVANDDDELQHQTALALAKLFRSDSPDEVSRRIVEWLTAATIIRDSVIEARRLVKNRARSKKSPPDANRYHQLLVEIAVLVVLRVSDKTDIGELSPKEIDHVKAAIDEAYRCAGEVSEKISRERPEGVDANVAAAHVALTSVGASAYGHATDTQVSGTTATSAWLGKGKHNAPMHVAALTLAELGFSTTDIHRTLQSANVRDLKDRAQIRRLIRPARVS